MEMNDLEGQCLENKEQVLVENPFVCLTLP